MIPRHLKITGFLSYQETVELDFDEFTLACITGANGAGKSSLLDAMTWALFGEARRRDDTVINTNRSITRAEVVFDFDYENNHYRVLRAKPRDKATVLEFFIDNDGGWRALTEPNTRATEERIRQTLRLDYETFINASFFLQGKADQFAQQKASERKRILGSILGLDTWETYRQAAADRRKTRENEVAVVDGQLAEIDSELNEEDQRKNSLKALEGDLAQATLLRKAKEEAQENLRRLAATLDEQRKLVETLKNQLDATQRRRDEIDATLQTRRADREGYRIAVENAALVEEAYRAWQTAREELARWEQIATSFREHEQKRTAPRLAIESERATLEQERRGLEEQERQARDLSASLPTLQKNLEDLNRRIGLLKAQLDERADLEAELRAALEGNATMQAENLRLRDEMDELKERIDTLGAVSGATCPLCGQPLGEEERARLVENLQAQGKEMGDRYRANLAETSASDQRKKEIEKELLGLKKAEEEWMRLTRQADQAASQMQLVQSAVDLWAQNGAASLAECRRKLDQGDFALAARKDLAAIDEALRELGYDASAHDAARQREQDGRSSEEALRGLERARAALEPLDREISGLEEQDARLEKEIATQQESWQASAARYEAEAASVPDLRQAEVELFNLRERENVLRMQVGAAMQKVDVLQPLRLRREDLKARRDEAGQEIARLKTLERAFGKDGIPALLIEQALPELESHANEILDRLSGGTMSVRFATQREYRDKKRDDMKETLDILISDAAGQREYELFSGGEAFRVNFAIRLALSRVLAQRAGARLQTLVIDEGFGSQDTDGRTRLIEAINLVRPDFEKILIITHLEELKDAFPARIEVEKTLRGSRVRVLA